MPLYNSTRFNQWELIDNNYSAYPSDKFIVDTEKEITVTLPFVVGAEIEIFNAGSNNVINIDLQGKKYNGKNYLPADLIFEGALNHLKIVYLNEDVGWFPIHGELYFVTSSYPPGMALWIEGSLNDKSTYGHKVTNIGLTIPEIETGLDFKPVLRWDGSRTQEIRIPPFLNGTDGVTLYAVFTVNSPDSYTIIKTISGNDNWYHDVDGHGDFGTFQDIPLNNYPLNMPASGSHLVSIHASSDTYEVLLDNKSKGLVSGSYNPGKIFAIGSRSRPFNGDIALILCYPGFLSPTSFFHRNCINKIKSFYPSLPFLIDNNEDS